MTVALIQTHLSTEPKYVVADLGCAYYEADQHDAPWPAGWLMCESPYPCAGLFAVRKRFYRMEVALTLKEEV